MLEVEESGWPIIVARHLGPVTDDDLNTLFELVQECLDRRERFGLMLDLREGIGDMSPAQRKRVVEHIRSTADRSGTGMVQAIIYDHPLHRAMYERMSQLYPLPFPSKAFPEPESARVWLLDKLSSVSGGGRAR